MTVFLAGDLLDVRDFTSIGEKIRVINSVLRRGGRYLLVLDGLEVLQEESGDDYGLIKNHDFRDWLRGLAGGENQAFCLVTTRAPLLDLLDFSTFTHRDVERLSDGEGYDLLRKLGVQGEEAALIKVVQDWDGYALILSLLGTYLVERYSGDVAQIGEIAAPLRREPRYDRVRRVLRRYDEHLTEAEREVMTVFSAFRLPVKEEALNEVLSPLAPLIKGGTGVMGILARLIKYRMLRYDERHQHYTTHPLIRNHYLEGLQERHREEVQGIHKRIKSWYLANLSSM